MKLYELSETYRNLSEYLNEENIVDAEQFKAQLTQITEQLNVKAENIGKLVLELEAESNAIKNEVDRLAKRKNTIENKITWLKEYLLIEMQTANLEKIKGQILTVSVKKNQPSVIVLDPNLVPVIFRRIIPETFEIDKKLILQNFGTSGEIPNGCDIKTDKKHVEIK